MGTTVRGGCCWGVECCLFRSCGRVAPHVLCCSSGQQQRTIKGDSAACRPCLVVHSTPLPLSCMTVLAAVAHIKLHDTGTWWRFDDEEAVEMGLQPTTHPGDHGTTAATATAGASGAAAGAAAAGSAEAAADGGKPADGSKKRGKGAGGAAGSSAKRGKKATRGGGRGGKGGGKGRKGGKKDPWDEDSEADSEAEAATAAAEAAAEQDAQLQQALQMSLLDACANGWVGRAGLMGGLATSMQQPTCCAV